MWSPYWLHQVAFNVQWNSIITNSSGPAIFVRYNRVHLCTNDTNLALKSVRYKRVFFITEFVINEFHCIYVIPFVLLKCSEEGGKLWQTSVNNTRVLRWIILVRDSPRFIITSNVSHQKPNEGIVCVIFWCTYCIRLIKLSLFECILSRCY